MQGRDFITNTSHHVLRAVSLHLLRLLCLLRLLLPCLSPSPPPPPALSSASCALLCLLRLLRSATCRRPAPSSSLASSSSSFELISVSFLLQSPLACRTFTLGMRPCSVTRGHSNLGWSLPTGNTFSHRRRQDFAICASLPRPLRPCGLLGFIQLKVCVVLEVLALSRTTPFPLQNPDSF